MRDFEKQMAVDFLEAYSEYRSNRGCNDLDIDRWKLTPEQKIDLDKRYHEWNGDPEEHDPEWAARAKYFTDFCIISLVAEDLKEHFAAVEELQSDLKAATDYMYIDGDVIYTIGNIPISTRTLDPRLYAVLESRITVAQELFNRNKEYPSE